jgi:hypothetical protein
MDPASARIGGVVQLNPETVENKSLGLCMMVIDEVKSWGCPEGDCEGLEEGAKPCPIYRFMCVCPVKDHYKEAMALAEEWMDVDAEADTPEGIAFTWLVEAIQRYEAKITDV